ncbi:MAG: hypothetical protein WBG71_00065 [Leeuwenhoekiella sp.]
MKILEFANRIKGQTGHAAIVARAILLDPHFPKKKDQKDQYRYLYKKRRSNIEPLAEFMLAKINLTEGLPFNLVYLAFPDHDNNDPHALSFVTDKPKLFSQS